MSRLVQRDSYLESRRFDRDGAPRESSTAVALGLIGSLGLHGVLAACTVGVVWLTPGVTNGGQPSAQELVFVDTEPDVPPRFEPPEPIEPPDPVTSPVSESVLDPRPPVRPAAQLPSDEESPGPDELAQTARALTSDEGSETLPTGDADTFAGGLSGALGTSGNPVWSRPRSARTARTRALGAPPPPELEPELEPPSSPIVRRPWPRNGSWNMCRFPQNAKEAGLEDARITIVVHVTEKGKPTSVDVLFESPNGYGFGEAARRCAMRRRYHPGRNAEGEQVAAATDPFKVRMLKDR